MEPGGVVVTVPPTARLTLLGSAGVVGSTHPAKNIRTATVANMRSNVFMRAK
jgi:hypothetical protein